MPFIIFSMILNVKGLHQLLTKVRKIVTKTQFLSLIKLLDLSLPVLQALSFPATCSGSIRILTQASAAS